MEVKRPKRSSEARPSGTGKVALILSAFPAVEQVRCLIESGCERCANRSEESRLSATTGSRIAPEKEIPFEVREFYNPILVPTRLKADHSTPQFYQRTVAKRYGKPTTKYRLTSSRYCLIMLLRNVKDVAYHLPKRSS